MKSTNLLSLFVFLTLTVLMVSAVSAATIFSDGFEASSQFSTSVWSATQTGTISTSQWIVATISGNAASGNNYAEATPAISPGPSSELTNLTLTKSTVGNQSLILNYKRRLGETGAGAGLGLDEGDYFKVLYSIDGNTFTSITSEEVIPISPAVVQNQDYGITRTFSFPPTANDNPNFKVRFECKTSDQDEFCRIDDISLEGTAIPTPSTNLTLTTPTSPVSLGRNATLTVTNTGGQNLTNIQITETTSPSLGLTFVPQTISSLTQGSSTTVQALTTGLGTLKFGLHTAQVKATSGAQTATGSFQIKKTFCSSGETPSSNVSITNIAWSNDGEGDDNNWEYLDEIELEVDIKNNDNDDDVDAIVKLGLYDSSGKNVADDLIFLEDSDSDDEQIDINIDDDDEETVTWVFKVPADFDKGNYKLAVKVYDEDAGESNSCKDSSNDLDNSFFQNIEIKESTDEGRFVVVDEISIDDQVACGQTLNGQFTLFNIGNEDQDRVKVLIKNNALNVDEEIELTSDLDKGDDETLEFSVLIPATVENGNYVLEFTTLYDYRNGIYREESEETFDKSIEVAGCSEPLGGSGPGSLTDTIITAELDSEARAGEQLIIKATIENIGTEEKTYTISARDYDDWATLDDISDSSFTLEADENKEITLTFTVDDDAEGSQTFDIQAASEGRVQVQEVEVELEGAKKGFTFDFKDNSFVWVIGLVNLVLIILIIVVAVRLAKR